VLTSLDVCDELGISGLTISSDTDCLAITGAVEYTFEWGDYQIDAGGTTPGGRVIAAAEAGDRTVLDADGSLDWVSKLSSWIQFTATANSDFGPAKAVIKIKDVQHVDGWSDGGPVGDITQWGSVVVGGSDTDGPIFDEAYVAIGDTTM